MLVGALDHDVAGGVGIAAHDALVAQHVAVGVDRRVGAGDGGLGVEQRLEHLVRHGDGGQRPPARLGVIGRHHGDRLADVAHVVAGEHRLVGGDQAVRRLARHVGRRQHRGHARDRQRRRRVDER